MLVVVLAACGCGLHGYDGIPQASTDAGPDVDSAPLIPSNAIVVSVLEDRMAGPATMTSAGELPAGTSGLALREALAIVTNNPDFDLILFDDEVFSEASPGAITLGSGLEIRASGITLDCGGAVEFVGVPVGIRDSQDVTIKACHLNALGGDALSVSNSSGITIESNVILDSEGRSILVDSSDGVCSGISIVSNRIERAGADLIGVYDCKNVRIEDNFMNIGDKGAQRGIHFERVVDSSIAKNIIDPGEARLINFQDSSNNTIQGNILDRGDAGVVLYGVSKSNLITMNVAMDMVFDGFYVGGEALDNIIVNNTMFRCSTALVDGGTGTITGNNLVSTDPSEFIDPTPGPYDFRLALDSPHIDAGAELGYDCLPDDPALFLGDAPDLGAVESY